MILIENLSKSYKVARSRRAILKQIFGLSKAEGDFDQVHSLEGIDLRIESGEAHGIIGMNGAGKSTLLKLLTGVIDPSSGTIQMQGKVAALLELGTGFHSELTGRENIYTNAAVNGMTRDEIDSKIESIEQFAELGHFFDRKVKIYSSGMYVRLAFAYAISIEPNVLIIDEALSVGDAYFQQKCLKKIRDFKEKGTTILFVSHDLQAVRLLCDRVTLLHKGKVRFSGSPLQALDLYNALLAEHKNTEMAERRIATADSISSDERYESGSGEITITRVTLLNSKGQDTNVVESGEHVRIEIFTEVKADYLEDATCGILIKDRLGYEVFGTNSTHLGIKTPHAHRGAQQIYSFSFALDIGPGDFTMTVALHSGHSHVETNFHWIDRALLFHVLPTPDYNFIGVARLKPLLTIKKTTDGIYV